MARTPAPALTAEVCIVGAGPQALAVAALLAHADPSMVERLVVVDPSGAWLNRWRCQFVRLDIGNLRSPVVHHPGVVAGDLCRFVAEQRLQRSGLPYDPPLAATFAAYCDDLIARYGLPSPVRSEVSGIERREAGLVVQLADGPLPARHVVLATNPHRRVAPDWLETAAAAHPERVSHGDDVDLGLLGSLSGQRVVVVGGGLGAGHLATGAARLGAEVALVARRPIELRNFDTDPGWLGPRHLAAWGALADPAERHRAVLAARGGGTMPEWMWHRLARLVGEGRLQVLDGRDVASVSVKGGVGSGRRLAITLDDGTGLAAHRLWAATGTVADIQAQPGLEKLLAGEHLVGGLPLPADDLRIGGLPLFVTGRLASLALGPAAGNLWGAQRAARRIVKSVTGMDVGLDGGLMGSK